MPGRSTLPLLVPISLMGFPVIGGCGRSALGRGDIQSPDPNTRIRAIVAAGQARDVKSVPLLVDRLDDEDEGVRFYAILALDRITGQRMGYDYRDLPEERAASVERWRAYVRDGGHERSRRSHAGDYQSAEEPGGGARGGRAAGEAGRLRG